MYTIIMNNDKFLTASIRTTIFQRENLVDKIQFLFPENYGDVNFADYIAVLKYVDQGNELHIETLARDSELYKGKLRYVLPIDTKLTRFAGNISVRVLFIQDYSTNAILNPVFKTGEHIITINPDDTIVYAPDVVERMVILESKVNETETSIEELKATKADSIDYDVDTNTVSLNAQGAKISSAQLDGDCDCEDGVPVVDFSVVEPEMPDGMVDNVVEF